MKYLFILLALLFPSTLFAAASYDLLAPILGTTTLTSLKDYLLLVFRAAIGLAGVLAVVMIVVCGIKLMGNPSVSGKSEAKECIWNAIFGVILILGSWLLLNTINPLLLNNDIALVGIASAPTVTTTATTEPDPTAPGCYFKYKDNNSGNTRFSRSSTCPVCDKIRTQYQADTTNYTVLSACYEIVAGTPPPPPPASTPPPATTGVICPQSGLNLCEEQPRQCSNSNCAQFAPMATTYASGAVSAAMIKAVIMQASSCGIQLSGGGGTLCGPMQVKVSTANMYKSACGVTDTITCGWLSNKANWDKSVCLGVEALKAVAASSCGSDPRNIIAGYNAGIGACGASADCSADTSCSGTTVQKWECLYDDSAHTECNTGYSSTRNYVTRALYCTAHPGY